MIDASWALFAKEGLERIFSSNSSRQGEASSDAPNAESEDATLTDVREMARFKLSNYEDTLLLN